MSSVPRLNTTDTDAAIESGRRLDEALQLRIVAAGGERAINALPGVVALRDRRAEFLRVVVNNPSSYDDQVNVEQWRAKLCELRDAAEADVAAALQVTPEEAKRAWELVVPYWYTFKA